MAAQDRFSQGGREPRRSIVEGLFWIVVMVCFLAFVLKQLPHTVDCDPNAGFGIKGTVADCAVPR